MPGEIPGARGHFLALEGVLGGVSPLRVPHSRGAAAAAPALGAALPTPLRLQFLCRERVGGLQPPKPPEPPKPS